MGSEEYQSSLSDCPHPTQSAFHRSGAIAKRIHQVYWSQRDEDLYDGTDVVLLVQ